MVAAAAALYARAAAAYLLQLGAAAAMLSGNPFGGLALELFADALFTVRLAAVASGIAAGLAMIIAGYSLRLTIAYVRNEWEL